MRRAVRPRRVCQKRHYTVSIQCCLQKPKANAVETKKWIRVRIHFIEKCSGFKAFNPYIPSDNSGIYSTKNVLELLRSLPSTFFSSAQPLKHLFVHVETCQLWVFWTVVQCTMAPALAVAKPAEGFPTEVLTLLVFFRLTSTARVSRRFNIIDSLIGTSS